MGLNQIIGTINISLDGASPPELERCRHIIHLLFEQGVFNQKNGYATIHFDNNGFPSKIEVPRTWLRDKPPPIAIAFQDAKVEVAKTPPRTTSGLPIG